MMNNKYRDSVRTVRVLHVFGRMQRGGAELRTIEVMRYLQGREVMFDYCALSGKQGELDTDISALGGTVHLCGLDVLFPIKFRRLLRHGQFDVVHSHVHHTSGLILRLAAMEGVPARIAHYRSMGDGKTSTVLRQAKRAIMKRWIDRHATGIVAVSRGAMAYSWRQAWQDDSRCRVIYNGVAIPDVRMKEDASDWDIRSEFGLPKQSTIIIHVGRMDPSKNHARLIHIFASLARRQPDTHLLLVGRKDREIERHVVDIARQLNVHDNIIIAGQRCDVRQLIRRADLMLFPSVREGLPGVVLEAASVGLPVLASALPGIVEIADYVLGVDVLSLEDQDDEWADRALALLLAGRDPEFREAIQVKFRSSPFTIDRSAMSFVELWKSYG